MSSATFVVPGNVDDPTSASGGNVYDRRMCDYLGVRKIAIPGTWPDADPTALAESLAALPDGSVVVIDGLVACGSPDVIVPAAARLRVVVLVHLPLADEAGLKPEVAADLDARERRTLHAAAAVLATSAWSARRLIEHHELTQVHVVAPGTDSAPLARGTDGRSRLLCLAAVTPHKGQDLLVEALAGLSDLPWTCACVGPLERAPAFVTEVRSLIAEHGLGGRVELTGPRTGGALEAEFAVADLVVLPSRGETYGMVIAESLMRGLPVLATAAGAVPDTVGTAPDGSIPGILVPQRTSTAFETALRRWLTEPDLPDQLRASAKHRRAALPDWRSAAREMSTVLENLESTWAA